MCKFIEIIITDYRFWSFATNEADNIQSQIVLKSSRLTELQNEISTVTEFLDYNKDSMNSQLDLAESRRLVSELEQKVSEISLHLSTLLKSDPATINKLKQAINSTTLAANVWTDNIFILRQYLTRRGVLEEDVNREFNIPEDLDTFDLP
jgi:hypothetical protein